MFLDFFGGVGPQKGEEANCIHPETPITLLLMNAEARPLPEHRVHAQRNRSLGSGRVK